jgi:hypothetical protein
MFYDPPKEAFLYRPGFNAKLLEAIAPQKPRVIFMASDQKPWSWYLHSPAETQLCVASCVANGANVWWGLHGSTQLLSTASGQASRDIFRFLAENESYLENTKAIAKVGLLYSFTSERAYHSSYEASDFTGDAKKQKNKKRDLTQSLYGCYNMLVHSQIPFSILTDFDSSIETYYEYDCIILPSVTSLPEKAVTELRKFVSNGGNLIATFDCTLFNEDGKQQKDFALADVFGVHFDGEYFTLPNYNYFISENKTHWLFEGANIPYYPSPLAGIKVKSQENAKVLARYLAPLPGRYDALTRPENPLIIHNRFGKGQCLYFAGAIGQMYNEYSPVEYRKIFANTVRRFSTPIVEIANGNLGACEVVLRSQNDKLLIHLVNHNGDMTRPIEQVETLQNIQIKVFVQSKFSTAKGLVSKKNLKLVPFENGYTLTIPQVERYEIVVMD